MTAADAERAGGLVTALAAVRGRIAAACAEVGRDPRAVSLIAVTKLHPVSDVITLLRLGIADFGESREQEAGAKISAVAGEVSAEALPQPRWHFLGQIQSRKARRLAAFATSVHSVDRAALVPLLADGARRAEREPLDVFVQVSLDGDPSRGGASPETIAPLADAVAQRGELRLRGVMAIAPLAADTDAAFARLAEISANLRNDHPDAAAISAGMSGDLEAAIRHGATHVRIGTALLGRRPAGLG